MADRLAPERTGLRDSRPAEFRTDWQIWGTEASIVVDRAEALPGARSIAAEVLSQVTAACSRFEPGSELSRLQRDARLSEGLPVSPILAELVAAALRVAADTGGSVDPTLGGDLMRLGYDRDLSELDPVDGEVNGVTFAVSAHRKPGWLRVRLAEGILSVPADILLDLGASAKAFAADRIAHRVAAELGSAVLVALGGDIATAGERSAWEVLVQDRDDDPAQQVSIGSGTAVATSSSQKRRWRQDGAIHQHILDPAFGTPVVPVWRSVTVAAPTCLRANALSTAAIVRGRAAVAWLSGQGADARLVDLAGDVITVGAWPRAEQESAATASGGIR